MSANLHGAISMYAPVSGMGFSPLTGRSNNTAAQRVFMTFKSTRTILTPIEFKIRNEEKFVNLSKSGGLDKEAIQTMSTDLKMILECYLDKLFGLVDQSILHVQSILSKGGISPDVEKIATTILISCFNLLRVESTLLFDAWKGRGSRKSISSKDINEEIEKQENEERDDLVVCRICDEHVPASLFEQHTKSCMNAYRSESRLNKLNQKLNALITGIENDILKSEDWPGMQEAMVVEIIPILQVYFLLKKAYLTDSYVEDSADDLNSIYHSMQTISKTNQNIATNSFLKEGTLLILEKTRICIALTNIASVLRTTRVSGSDRTSNSPDKISITDFFFVKRVSAGAYARVFLGRKKKTGDLFAIKVLPRKEMVQKNQVKRVLAERDILMQFTNPFIVNFYYSIISKNNLYLVMEYLPGGDLFSLLDTLGSLDEDSAKLYTLEIAQALQYLRSNGIIHRDLKPDNILVSSTGMLKLTDFGLSHLGSFDRQAVINDPSLVSSSSLVGTPDYTAPEIILNRTHSFSCDYWSLGVMLYEFLMGQPPFHGETESETHTNILRATIDWNEMREEGFSEEVIDLLQKLLITDPEKRLGARDINEILNHPWFKGVDPKTTPPPFVPSLETATDTEYFTQRYQFQTQDDSDILQDIAESEAAADNKPDEEDIDKFQAVSFNQLVEKNELLVQDIRRRSISGSFDLSDETTGSSVLTPSNSTPHFSDNPPEIIPSLPISSPLNGSISTQDYNQQHLNDPSVNIYRNKTTRSADTFSLNAVQSSHSALSIEAFGQVSSRKNSPRINSFLKTSNTDDEDHENPNFSLSALLGGMSAPIEDQNDGASSTFLSNAEPT